MITEEIYCKPNEYLKHRIVDEYYDSTEGYKQTIEYIPSNIIAQNHSSFSS